ncbi:MAG: hypothetical protein R2713_10960 [Ilumatobacteraceae bacterium]
MRSVAIGVATVTLIGGAGVGGWFGYQSEPVQRAFGRREATRVEADQVRPVYGSIELVETSLWIGDGSPSTMRTVLTTAVDLETSRLRRGTKVEPTWLDAQQTALAPDPAVQPATAPDEIWDVTGGQYAASEEAPGGWVRQPDADPAEIVAYLSDHLVPVRNDLIGLELASLPVTDLLTTASAIDQTVEDASEMVDVVGPGERGEPAPAGETGETGEGAVAAQVPPVTLPEFADDIVDLRRWRLDAATFRRLAPVAFDMVRLSLTRDAELDLTMGFDATGALRYLSVTADPSGVVPADDGTVTYHASWSVVSTNPAGLDLPDPAASAGAEPVAP